MDPPLLTATDSTADTADVRPSQATTCCNQFLDETARCTADVVESRHGTCLKHMTCVIADSYERDGDKLSRCIFAPSSCLVCNLVLESLNKALGLPQNDAAVAKVKAGTKAMENIIFVLETTFKTVQFQDRYVHSWLFAVRAMKWVTLEDYKITQDIEILPRVVADPRRSNKTFAINYMTGEGWTWIDGVNVERVRTDTGDIGIRDNTTGIIVYLPNYEYRLSAETEFYRLTASEDVIAQIGAAERLKLKRKTLQAAFEKNKYRIDSNDENRTTINVDTVGPSGDTMNDETFMKSLEKWSIPEVKSFYECNVLNVTSEAASLRKVKRLVTNPTFNRTMDVKIPGLILRKPNRDVIDNLNYAKRDFMSLNTSMTGIHNLVERANKLARENMGDSTAATEMMTVLGGINILNHQLIWNFKTSTIRFTKAMKAVRRNCLGQWAPGIVALDDLVHEDTVSGDIFSDVAAEKCKNALNNPLRGDSSRLARITVRPNPVTQFFRGQSTSRGEGGFRTRSNYRNRFSRNRGRNQRDRRPYFRRGRGDSRPTPSQ